MQNALVNLLTQFVLEVNPIRGDGAATIKHRRPADSDGPLLHLSCLYSQRVRRC